MQRGIQNIFQNYSSICFLNGHPVRLLLFKFAVPQLAEYPCANLSHHISYHHILLILNAAGRATPFQDLWMGSCLTQKWTVQGDTHADKARDFTGKGPLGGEQEEEGTQKRLSDRACSLGFYGDGTHFQAVSDQAFSLRVFPSDTYTAQPKWTPARRTLRGW